MLHELDRLWKDPCSQLGQLGYADDAVLLCRTEAQAREALWRVGVILARLKLTLHPTKTQVVFVGDGRQRFDFLGLHCRKVEFWKDRKYRRLHRWPCTRVMQRIRDRIKAIGIILTNIQTLGLTIPPDVASQVAEWIPQSN